MSLERPYTHTPGIDTRREQYEREIFELGNKRNALIAEIDDLYKKIAELEVSKEDVEKKAHLERIEIEQARRDFEQETTTYIQKIAQYKKEYGECSQSAEIATVSFGELTVRLESESRRYEETIQKYSSRIEDLTIRSAEGRQDNERIKEEIKMNHNELNTYKTLIEQEIAELERIKNEELLERKKTEELQAFLKRKEHDLRIYEKRIERRFKDVFPGQEMTFV